MPVVIEEELQVSNYCFSQKQLADRWGMNEVTLERWRVEGIGPSFLKLNGQVRYRIDDIELYERKCFRRASQMEDYQ